MVVGMNNSVSSENLRLVFWSSQRYLRFTVGVI